MPPAASTAIRGRTVKARPGALKTCRRLTCRGSLSVTISATVALVTRATSGACTSVSKYCVNVAVENWKKLETSRPGRTGISLDTSVSVADPFANANGRLSAYGVARS